eukprot:scaffold79988_cov63-Phaeocystis_antarctica.AAC.2
MHGLLSAPQWPMTCCIRSWRCSLERWPSRFSCAATRSCRRRRAARAAKASSISSRLAALLARVRVRVRIRTRVRIRVRARVRVRGEAALLAGSNRSRSAECRCPPASSSLSAASRTCARLKCVSGKSGSASSASRNALIASGHLHAVRAACMCACSVHGVYTERQHCLGVTRRACSVARIHAHLSSLLSTVPMLLWIRASFFPSRSSAPAQRWGQGQGGYGSYSSPPEPEPAPSRSPHPPAPLPPPASPLSLAHASLYATPRAAHPCRHAEPPQAARGAHANLILTRRTSVGMQRLSRLREELVAASQVEERVRIGRLQPRGRAELLRRLRVPARREERRVARLALPGAATVERRDARL